MNYEEIGIITSGFLPVPATKGGAVENLIVNVLNKNEENQKMSLVVFSVYDKKAIEEAKKYKNTKFEFIKINCLVQVLDKVIYFFAKNILKKTNSQSYRYILQRLYYLNKVSKLLKKNEYDKVLLENHPTQFLALKWRKNYKKYAGRYYYHCHNEFPGEYGCHEIILRTKNIICVSEYIKNTLSKYLNMKDNISVLRNGIDDTKFSIDLSVEEKNEIKKVYNIEENERVIIFTGRIVPEKGVLELIKAIKKVKSEKYKLLIVGASLNALESKSKYEELVESELFEVKNKVIFTGFVKYEEIPKLYKIADIAVMPSIWNDPAPLTIIESLTCGVPIITTKSGGIPEYAVNNSAVILDRDDNLIETMAKEIDSLLNDKNRREEMSLNGKKAAKKLTLDNYFENFVKLLNIEEK